MTPPNQEYRTIPLTQGKVAIVDAADYERMARFKWYAKQFKGRDAFYAACSLPMANGTRRTMLMHREVLSVGSLPSSRVDHKDRERTLDNRRANLRIATPSQNAANAARPITNTSGYKGVSFHSQTGKFRAQIRVNKKSISLGYRETAEEAYELYCSAAKRYFGEFARVA